MERKDTGIREDKGDRQEGIDVNKKGRKDTVRKEFKCRGETKIIHELVHPFLIFAKYHKLIHVESTSCSFISSYSCVISLHSFLIYHSCVSILYSLLFHFFSNSNRQ